VRSDPGSRPRMRAEVTGNIRATDAGAGLESPG